MAAQGRSIDCTGSTSLALGVGFEAPGRLLESSERLFAIAKAASRGLRLELYSRATIRVRARREAGSRAPILESGRDEGLAVRTQDRHGRVRFAAVSGIEPAAVSAALAAATGSPGVAIEQPWVTGVPDILTDVVSGSSPRAEELARWLRAAVPAGCPAWVEAGHTVETIVADGGLRAIRARDRLWAVAIVSRAGEERPRMVAGRALSELDPAALAPSAVLETPPIAVRDIRSRLPWIVEPAEASILVKSLATALCGPEGSESVPVGRGFCLEENPQSPLGLAGGAFDDAGFPTRVNLLTIGGFTARSPLGPGHYRRDSFRDPPQPGFGTLVIADGTDERPEDCILLEGLRVSHLAADRWTLELAGTWIEQGRPVRPLAATSMTTDPVDLVQRFRGAVGPARACPNGIATPTLILEL